MPAKKTTEETVIETKAEKKTEEKFVVNDDITVAIPKKAVAKKETRVRVYIPMPPESESGLKVDPYEHVTINGQPPVLIKRGEYVDVTVPVYLQLRNRYPKI